MINVTKVVIIGAGAVGSTVAYSLVLKGIAAEVVLVDRNLSKARGEALDMQHSMEFQNRNVRIYAGDYKDCADADMVIITAAAPLGGEIDRLAMQDKSAAIVSSIVPKVMESGFDGIFLVVSNPVDVMAYLVYKISGMPKERVIGTGTVLEPARLKHAIGEIMNMDPRSVDAYVMGEHGDSMMVPWSHVRAGGKNFPEILKDSPERFKGVTLERIVEQTRLAGREVLVAKGNTQYGIASAVTGIVKAILHDENKMLPVSVYLDGEYQVEDVYCGVPAILNRTGVKEIGEFHLTPKEQQQFMESAAVLKSAAARLTK